MDEVNETGQPLLVTKRGKPSIKVFPRREWREEEGRLSWKAGGGNGDRRRPRRPDQADLSSGGLGHAEMILLDTHVLVWSQMTNAGSPGLLTSAIRRDRASRSLAISAISMVEVANLMERERIRIRRQHRRCRLEVDCRSLGFYPSPRDRRPNGLLSSGFSTRSLGPYHRRHRAAEGIPLVTADQRIQACPLIKTIW